MDAEQVIEKILSEANGQAQKITQQAVEDAAAEQTRLDAELAEYNKQSEVLAEKAGAEKKHHLLAAVRMKLAKEFLVEKRKIIDKVFAKAREQVGNLSDNEYCEIMEKLMLASVETGDEEVVVDKNETRIDQKFIKQVNRKLGPGFQGNLRLSEEREDIGAGFIMRRGKIKNNASLDVLLSQGRQVLEIELAKELFRD